MRTQETAQTARQGEGLGHRGGAECETGKTPTPEAPTIIVLNTWPLKRGRENQETFLPRANPLVFNLMMFNSGDDPATVAGWGRASLFATHHTHAAEAKSNTSMTAIIHVTRLTTNAIIALLQTKCEARKNSQTKHQHTLKRQDERNAKQGFSPDPLLVHPHACARGWIFATLSPARPSSTSRS
jgi:hypothetical protein